MSSPFLIAIVKSITWEAEGVISIELHPAPGSSEFVNFEPGSHIDLNLPNGLVRSYSLLNDSRESHRYVVAVLKDAKSRGGSKFIHEQLHVGTTLQISKPRNNFPLESSGEKKVLVAGGIGVTPILGMLRYLRAHDAEVDFIYCARSRKQAAFLADIEALTNHRIHLQCHFDDEMNRPPDLKKLLVGYSGDTHLYCCGPVPMLTAFEDACNHHAYENFHIERFSIKEPVSTDMKSGYTIELKKSGKFIAVAAGQSVLDALLAEGLNPEHSCREGLCGACETRVLCGEVEHLDSILTKKEQIANKSMMICVSHGKGDVLVLDI